MFFFPSSHIYSYQLVYLNYNEKYTFKFDSSFNNQYRFFINSTYGNGEICFDKNCTDKSAFSGRRILSFPFKNEVKTIDIHNKYHSPLLFSVKIDYEFENKLLEEIQFNNVFKEVKNNFPIKYIIKDKEYKGADINFYFDINNTKIKKDDLIIKGYLINYAKIKVLDFIGPLNLNSEEIIGKFDNRTNLGVIIFVSEIIEKYNGLDYYYLIIVNNQMNSISNIPFDIYPISKDNPDSSLIINKYVSGLFNLTKNINKSQKYYINEYNEQNSNNNYIIEFSSNYKNIELSFNNSKIKYKYTTSDGIIQKYFVFINYTETNEAFFEVKLLNDINYTNDNNDNYLKEAYYILKYYSIMDQQEINKIFDISNELIPNNNNSETNSYILKIKNNNDNKNFNANYEFTYILNIYESTKILKNELINTIASIDSPTFYSNITFSNRPFKEKEYFLKNIILNEEYETSIFIKIKNTINEDKQYYYSHVFNLSVKNKKKGKDYKLLIYLIIGVISLIVISFIALLIKYRIIMKKNRNLEEQVINLSLSEKNEDNEENKDDKVFLI